MTIMSLWKECGFHTERGNRFQTDFLFIAMISMTLSVKNSYIFIDGWNCHYIFSNNIPVIQSSNYEDNIHHGITVYPKKYAHGFCFAVLCCGYTLTDFPISIRLTSLALWQSNDCPSASKATLMNMDKYFMCIHYKRLHNHNKAKHNTTVCIFLEIYCMLSSSSKCLPGL